MHGHLLHRRALMEPFHIVLIVLVMLVALGVYQRAGGRSPRNGGSRPWPQSTPERNDFLGVRDRPDHTGVDHHGGDGTGD